MTVVPFSTALLARYPGVHIALIEYWLNVALLGFSLLGAAEYALRAGLFDVAAAQEVVFRIRGRIWIAQGLYAVAVALGFVFQTTWVSIALIVLIQLNYVLAPRIPLLDRF